MDVAQAFFSAPKQMQEMATSRAQQQLYESQAATHQYELAQAQKVNQIMGSMATPEGAVQQAADIPDMLDQISQRFMGAGFPEKAGKLAADAAQIRERRANEKQNLALSMKQYNEGMLKAIDLSREILFNVRSPEDLERANALWAARTGTMSPLAGEMYSPELMQRFQDEMLSAKGHLTSQDRAANQALKEAEQASRNDMRKSIIALKEQTLEQRKREADLREKTGGKDVGTPTKEEIQQASRLIVAKYKSFKDEKDIREQAGFDIASEAKALRKANPGLSAGEALQQAFAKAEAAGDFQETSKWLGMSKAPEYKTGKKAPAEAAVPPAGERVVGKTSIVKDGKTYVWTEVGGQRGWAPAPGGK